MRKYIDQLAAADDVPDTLEYLALIFWRLDRMREVDMNGPRAFTPMLIEGAIRLFGWQLSTLEIEALVTLDTAVLSPGDWPTTEGAR